MNCRSDTLLAVAHLVEIIDRLDADEIAEDDEPRTLVANPAQLRLPDARRHRRDRRLLVAAG